MAAQVPPPNYQKRRATRTHFSNLLDVEAAIPSRNSRRDIKDDPARLRSYITGGALANAIAATLLAAAVFFFFLGLLAALSKDGLFLADEAYFAQVAKNLAFGLGYATAANADVPHGLSLFDPAITNGPVIILPAALLIHFFGNQSWVPGLTTILFVFVLNLGLFLIHFRRKRLWQASLFLLVFGALSYSTTALVQWYALVGEVPAALISVLGISLIAMGSPRAIRIGTVVMGCAVLAKLLAFLLCVPTLIWIQLAVWRDHGLNRAIVSIVRSMALFLLPEGLFLLWQLLDLGPTDFLRVQIAAVEFVNEQSRGLANEHDLLSQIANYAAQFADARGFSVTTMAACVVVVGFTVWRYGDPITKRLASLLFAASTLHFVWWIACSNGWQRYTVTGLVTYAAGIALVIFVRRPMLGLGLAALLVTVHLGSMNQPGRLFQLVQAWDFEPSERVQHLREATKILESLGTERPFVSGYWAPMVDLEYLLPQSGNFIPHFNLPQAIASRPFVLAYNKKGIMWMWQPGFVALVQRCMTIFAADPYYIKRCPAQSTQPPAS